MSLPPFAQRDTLLLRFVLIIRNVLRLSIDFEYDTHVLMVSGKNFISRLTSTDQASPSYPKMSDRAVLLGGASIIAGALLLNSLQSSNENEVTQQIATTEPVAAPQESIQYPEEIRHEIHSRVKTFFSEEGFQKLQDSFVVVSIISIILGGGCLH